MRFQAKKEVDVMIDNIAMIFLVLCFLWGKSQLLKRNHVLMVILTRFNTVYWPATLGNDGKEGSL